MSRGERISEADMERHRRMLGYLNEAGALQREARAAQVRALELLGAFKVWSEELHERYGLARDGSEGVNEDGTITRSRPSPHYEAVPGSEPEAQHPSESTAAP